MDDVEEKMQMQQKMLDRILEIVNGSSQATILSTCFALAHGVAHANGVPEEKSREFLMRQILEFVFFLDKEGKKKEDNDN